ncbi:MAG: hypothetical protein Q9174_001618 [Haloplaca sp. 1 TL-2023]
MYVGGTGIVYWPHDPPLRSESHEADAILVDTATVPGTGFSASTANDRGLGPLESRIGQVTHHIMLENFVVFTTDSNKIFCYQADFPLPVIDPPEPIEITAFYPTSPTEPFAIRDLQGSFRSFAIFTSSGGVLLGSRALIDAVCSGTYDPTATGDPSYPHPRIIPALQNNQITSIAFGDHHFQALRLDGTIFAYGADPQNCGALGLGFVDGTGPLRGLLANGGFSADGTLGRNVGRQVWFDPTMHLWLAEMKEKAGMEGEAKARGNLVLPGRGDEHRRRQHPPAVRATGDWFERKGAEWEDGIKRAGEMGSFFVLKAAAAGWHSAALVLVDDEMVEKVRQKHVRSVTPREEEGEAKKAAEDDGHGGTWEDIDAPWDQLSKAFWGLAGWLMQIGRRFLGLSQREQAAVVADEGNASEGEEKVDVVRYTWSDEPFPRLRMDDGEVMPGEIELMD